MSRQELVPELVQGVGSRQALEQEQEPVPVLELELELEEVIPLGAEEVVVVVEEEERQLAEVEMEARVEKLLEGTHLMKGEEEGEVVEHHLIVVVAEVEVEEAGEQQLL